MTNNESTFLRTIQLPSKIANRIEEAATNGPWWYLPDCAHKIGHELQKSLNPYFSCTLLKDGITKDRIHNYDLNFFNKYIGLGNRNMIRAHVTFHWPRPEHFGVPHNAHVDQPYPHTVALYYVNDTDGDTVFFDKDDLTKVIHRETPKKGKCVIFDGEYAYHASTSPSKNIRMTLNINYENL